MVNDLRGFTGIVPFIKEYFKEHHPGLEIINISSFGSYLEAEKPNDIDLLIVVRGNHFGLDEISIDLSKYPFGSRIKPSVRGIGMSIKGEDNFSYGAIDSACAVKEESQKPVLKRTAVALYSRHIVLFGPDFRRNGGLLEKNALAEISDLLINAYNRFYRYSWSVKLSLRDRSSKIMSRLYEAALYMAIFYPEENIEPEEFYRLRLLLQKGEAGSKEVDRAWKKINCAFERACARYDEARMTRTMAAEESDDTHLREMIAVVGDKVKKGELGVFLPIIARIVDKDGNIVATAGRRKIDPAKHSVTAVHAEIEAIRSCSSRPDGTGTCLMKGLPGLMATVSWSRTFCPAVSMTFAAGWAEVV